MGHKLLVLPALSGARRWVMTAISDTRSQGARSRDITVRIATLQNRSPLERYGYLFMRLTGVALIVLAIGHMMIQHVLNDVHNLTLEFVRQQWSSWGWRTYDLF